ncbi:hypothetical protein V8E36_008665 [Tilletia maclaganii]
MCDSTPDPKILSLATISTNPKPSQQVAINTTVYQRPGAMSGSSQRDPPSSFLALSPPHPSSSQPPSLTAAELDEIEAHIAGFLSSEADNEHAGDDTLVPSSPPPSNAASSSLPSSPRHQPKHTPARRKPVMDWRDVLAFLRFMTQRNLSIASILNLFFVPEEERVPAGTFAQPRLDDYISSSGSSSGTVEEHTVPYLKARIAHWVSRTGHPYLTRALNGRYEAVLPVVVARLEKEVKTGSGNPYAVVGIQGSAASDQPDSLDEEADIIEEGEDMDIDVIFNPAQASSNAASRRSTKIICSHGRRSKGAVVTAVAHMLLFAFNEQCNRWPLQIAVDLLGARVPRRSIELLSRLGVVASYASAIRVFRSMAEDDQKRSKSLAAAPGSTLSLSYDNVNWTRGVRDPRLEKSSQIMAAVAGTGYIHSNCAQYTSDQPVCSDVLYARTLGRNTPRPTTTTALLLNPVDDGVAAGTLRSTRDELRAQPSSKELKPDLYLPGRPEEEHIAEVLLSHALRSWVEMNPGCGVKLPDVKQPPQVLPMLPVKTAMLGLPVLNLDEGSVAGNIAVVTEYMDFLGIRTEDFCGSHILPIVADAFTVSHLRSAMSRRALDASTTPKFDQLQFLQPWAALFHLQYAFAKAFLNAHSGTSANQSPVSARILCNKIGLKGLCSGNCDFYKTDVYIKTLFAAMVDALLTPALRKRLNKPEGAQFTNLSVETLTRVGRTALSGFVCGSAESIALEHGGEDKADLLYLHGRAQLMDAALFIELRDSVKCGDLGRTLIAIKCILPRFAATGHNKYSLEVLETMHQIHTELSPAQVTTMLSSSISNHHGRRDSWLPADLDIEHQVKELKNAFRVTASTDVVKNGHLGQIISVLRNMRLRWYRALGISGSGEHTARPIKRGVALLSRHLQQASVFEWKIGRSCKTFELHYGDDVKRRKEINDKSARQSKGLTTDSNEYGVGKLMPMMSEWMARRTRDTSQVGAVLPPLEDEEIEDDWAFTDADIDALMGGFDMLGEDA